MDAVGIGLGTLIDGDIPVFFFFLLDQRLVVVACQLGCLFLNYFICFDKH